MTVTESTSQQPLSELGAADWAEAQSFLRDNPTKWRSLSWIAARSLIDSVNHVLADGARPLVSDLRQHWVGGKRGQALRIDQVAQTRFLVAGDLGEQDGSQYVVAPALSRTAANRGIGFVLMLSDLIYPSGDVNDYVDGFYKPYRSSDRASFFLDRKIFALPGNHDWYDGLYGFAYHFLPRAEAANADLDQVPGPGQELRWPDEILAPRFDLGLSPFKTVLDRFCRTMWRVPSQPAKTTTTARATTPHSGQPAPYFVIETAHVELVCIDIGIDGTVDVDQMEWLETLSQESRKPKILMTGKPLMVNGEVHPCSVVTEQGEKLSATVNNFVADPDNGYVATVGGDVHNFQLYRPGAETSSGLQHLVSGGGGAYTHATHPIGVAASDSRVQTSNETQPANLFPGAAESLSYFAQQLVPSVWLMFRAVLLFALGIAFGWVAAPAGWSFERAGLSVAVGSVAAAILAVLLIFRTFYASDIARERKVRRCLLSCEALVLGFLIAIFAHAQLQDLFERVLVLYVACSAWIGYNAWGIRRSRWWSPVVKGSLERRQHALFLLGLLAPVAVVLALAIADVIPVRAPTWVLVFAAASVLVYVVVAVGGWLYRAVPDPSKPGRASRWLKHSVWVASVAQALVIIFTVPCFLPSTHLIKLHWSGLAGVLLSAVVVLVLLVLPLLSGLPGSFVNSVERRRKIWRRCSTVMRGAVFLAAPLLVTAWGFAAEHWDSPAMKAALGLPALLTLLVGAALIIDKLRRTLGPVYKLVAVGALALGCAALVSFGLVSSWPVAVIASAAFTLLAVAAAVLLAHLVFVGAYWLVVDAGSHRSSRYEPPSSSSDPLPFWSFISEAEAEEILRAEREKGASGAAPAAVSDRVRRRAEIAFPGLNPPFGPIQKFVAEIYSRDEPPFFKHFLEFDTSSTQVCVWMHVVRGDRPVERQLVTTISLPGST